MKKLINEIEKIIVSLKRQYQNCFEGIDCPLFTSDEIRGKILAYQDCLNLLNQYNIITAPKTIKLSEIVNKLKQDYDVVKVNHYYSTYSDVKVADIGFFGTNPLKTIFEFDNEMKMVKVIAPQFESTKWLYTLWIANVEIINDMECDE